MKAIVIVEKGIITKILSENKRDDIIVVDYDAAETEDCIHEARNFVKRQSKKLKTIEFDNFTCSER